MAGDAEIVVAGGVESMSRAPLVMAKPETAFPRGDRTVWDTTLGWRFPNPRLEEMFPLESMGETGENVAERWVSRARIRTRSRCARSSAGRRRTRRDASTTSSSPSGEVVVDEHPRPETTAEALGGLQARVPVRRHGDGRQRERDQRRRRGARASRARRRRASSASSRSARSSARRSPASTRA